MKMPPRFIIVDDDPINNLLCGFGIRRVVPNANISVFTGPEDALAMILKDHAYPAEPVSTFLFLDLNMPSMTGWEFLDLFRNYDPYIQEQFKIFIVSSSVDDRDKDRASVTGLVSDFLSKPLKPEQIQQILSQHAVDGPGL